MKSTSQMEVNNKIRTASVDQYCGAFSKSDWPEILTHSRKTCLESPHKILAWFKVELRIIIVAVNLDCCAFYAKIQIWP
jgi:hypothetical protein